MTRHRVPLIATGLLGLAIAACSGSSATASPTTAPAATASAAGESASPSASTASSESPALPSLSLPSGSFAIPSLPSSDKDLEALLPSSVDGVTLQKASFSGADLGAGTGTNEKQFSDFLGQLGKSPSDASLAVAADATGKLEVTIGALRVKGADQNQLLQQFVTASQKNAAGVTVAQVSLGGKNATKISDPTDTSGAQYIYAKNDVLFFVQGKDETKVGDALAALP